MNQTKKRLSIINLAISITDIETIQLQILKLALLKSDSKIKEILSALNAQNYAQAQELIEAYIETPNDTIVQRTTHTETSYEQKETPNTPNKESTQKKDISIEDEAIIKEFDLFTTSAQNLEKKQDEEVDINALLDTLDTIKTSNNTQDGTSNDDTSLTIKTNDIEPENGDMDVSKKETTKKVKTKKISDEETHTQKDFDEHDNCIENTTKEQQTKEDATAHHTPSLKDSDNTNQNDALFEAIPHIETKFNNLYTQYPPIETTENRFYSVEEWLLQISTKGYTEEDIEKYIQEIQALKETNLAEAGQLLIAVGSTDSLYALFHLGRALFTGDILQRNTSEAVSIIHYLATNEEYPEAICDLAQLYEKGIELKKDKAKAKELYKEAMHLGIQRAAKHYQRLQNESKNIFAFFKK